MLEILHKLKTICSHHYPVLRDVNITGLTSNKKHGETEIKVTEFTNYPNKKIAKSQIVKCIYVDYTNTNVPLVVLTFIHEMAHAITPVILHKRKHSEWQHMAHEGIFYENYRELVLKLVAMDVISLSIEPSDKNLQMLDKCDEKVSQYLRVRL